MPDTIPNPNIAPNARAKQPPKWLAEKFWDPERGEVRVEDLARSYAELERMMSAPGGSGVPDAPEGYALDVDDLLEIDGEVNERLHAAGFSNDQAQLVYDLARERLVPLIERMSAEMDDDRHVNRLLEHFGGPERFEALRPQLRAWGQANLARDVFETLAGSAEGVIALHTMMQSGEPGLGAGAPGGGRRDEAGLKRMMADPRYWRERDPAYVAQVREGFRKLYPDG